MKSLPSIHERLSLTIALFLIFFGAFFRVFRLEWFHDAQNFAPLMAIACCGALLLPGWLAIAAPLGALIVSDILLNIHYGASIFAPEELIRYACFGFGAACGLSARRFHGSPISVLGIVAANSILFYLVTNTVSWVTEPAYAKNAAGWLQALTVGVPGYPPTWSFLRNSFVSDMLFAGLFLAAIRFASREPRTAAVHA
jgi:hypothetical protein